MLLLSFAFTIHKQFNCPKFTFQNASVSVKYNIKISFHIKIKIGNANLWVQEILQLPDRQRLLQLILDPKTARLLALPTAFLLVSNGANQ